MIAIYSSFIFCLLLTFGHSATLRFEQLDTWTGTVDFLNPVPRPLSQTSSHDIVCLSLDFSFVFSTNDCGLIRNYARGVHKRILDPVIGDASGACQMVKYVAVSIETNCQDNETSKIYPNSAMNESYVLTASGNSVSISAKEVWGAMRGLETLAQLVFKQNNGEISLYYTSISDEPRFKHRGLMLDTSRHYLHKSKLIETLNLMAMVKLNVFHWHVVDDQSFPYSSTTFPDMADKGAYNPYTRIYTQQDVADVIEEGRRLGVRVIPEFDSPGHTQSWGKGLPQLLTKCYSGSQPNGNFGPVDPSIQANYQTLSKLFGEILRVYPDSFLHLGGDEVSFTCWQSNPNITAFMKQKNISSYNDLESYYVNQLVQLVNAAQPVGKDLTTVVWQEVFDNHVKIPSNVLVHVWKDPWQAEMASVTKAGYNVLLSTCWYLNYISYGTDFGKYYNCDPQGFSGTTEQKNLVYGGEACMWGEYVDDSNVISRTWPRVSSVAEALWTNSTRKNLGSFTNRILGLQCRMQKQGFNAEPPNGPSTCARPLGVTPGT